MARLRMAVVGVGHLGKEHARILATLPDVQLVGVVDALGGEPLDRLGQQVGEVRHPDPFGLLADVDDHALIWTVVAVNDGKTSETVNVELPASAHSLRASRAVRTSAAENLATVSAPASSGTESFLLHLPAQSVTTFRFN